MKDKTTHLYVDSHERKLILHSLVELKNALIRQGRYTDCIDELIFKVANAPVKKMKIEYVYLCITEKAVYRRLDRLKEKIQKIFE